MTEVVVRKTGVESQQDAMRALRAKFGKPARYVIDHLQNRTGAHVVEVRAVWMGSGYIVKFDSTFDDLDDGLIQVMTPGAASRGGG